MIRCLKSLLIFICCFSEVHVMAEVPSPAINEKPKGLQFPEGCLNRQLKPCALKSTVASWRLQLGSVQVVLKENATIIWKDTDEVQVVSGDVWASAEQGKDVEIHSEFGHFQAVVNGLNVFIKKDSQTMEIYPLSEGVLVFPLGAATKAGHLLPVGYRSYLAGVGTDGVARYEIPVAANLKGLIQDWAPLFDGTPQQLSGFLSGYRESWVNAVNAGSFLHLDLAEREIASDRQRQEQRALRLKAQQEEERHLKQLFRQKNYLNQ